MRRLLGWIWPPTILLAAGCIGLSVWLQEQLKAKTLPLIDLLPPIGFALVGGGNFWLFQRWVGYKAERLKLKVEWEPRRVVVPRAQQLREAKDRWINEEMNRSWIPEGFEKRLNISVRARESYNKEIEACRGDCAKVLPGLIRHNYVRNGFGLLQLRVTNCTDRALVNLSVTAEISSPVKIIDPRSAGKPPKISRSLMCILKMRAFSDLR